MTDADRTADISLDTDRLEQLLEVPAPAQPVVMIEYRNRGVPWWLVVSLIVLVPLVAVLVYQQVVVERYAAAASKAHYLAEVLKNEKAVVEKPGMESVPVEPVPPAAAPGAAPVVLSAQAAPPPEAPKPASPPSPSEAKPAPARAEKVDEPTLAGAGQPPGARVRSIFPIQLEGAANAPDPKGVGAGSTGLASGTQDRTMFEEPVGAQPAGPQPPRAVASGPGEGGPTGKGTKGPDTPDPAAGSVDAASRPQAVPPDEPLPTKEELRLKFAEESARIGAEKAEEQLVLNDRLRVRRYEDRVRFHNELRQILSTDINRAEAEIDALAKRERGDSDLKTLAKARGIWRRGGVPLATRVNQIRALDVSEGDILNFMSDNLFARMHTPGGPRDHNEVRVRAARMLLSCELSSGAAPAAAGSDPKTPPARTRTGADPPQ